MTERSNKGSNRATHEAPKPFPVWKALVALALIAAIVFAAQLCSTAATINVTVNGTEYTLHGAKTMQTAIKESGLPINSGDLISLRGQILEKHGGDPFYATVNGIETVDPDMKLHNGDEITITDGHDVVENYESEYEPIPFSAVTGGLGALHIFIPGEEGTMETRTGMLSGEQVRKLQKEETDLVRWCYNPDVGDDKVIALTFDDGPSPECTAEILDILAENDAKATFFIVGSEIMTEEDAALVKRAYDEGHQLCTHTYTFGQSVSSFNFSSLAAQDQIDEINLGYQAISNVTGVEPSHCVRLPGGTMNDDAVLNVAPYIDAEIGWTIDTGDWLSPGSDVIFETIVNAEPGDIILCHDSANSEQTIEALRKALPWLKRWGYKFVTIDDMLVYPELKAEEE